jgi:serine/threonine protein kinase
MVDLVASRLQFLLNRGARTGLFTMDQKPRKISNFHLTSSLYSGGRSDVYKGRFAQAGGVVQFAAVKVLQPRFACIGHELRNFLAEAGWATELRSPLFPRVFEAGEHKGNYFLAMEFIDGWTLTKVLASLATLQVPLPCEVGLSIALQLATGLHKMHERREHDAPLGVVHLGINPDNIMLSKEGQARVLDFGMTIATVDRELTEVDDDAKDFQSPERLRGLPVDRRADIFALGRVLQHMVDCMVPEVIREDLPALLARSCHADADQRFETMDDFRVALELVAKNRRLKPSKTACEKFTLEIFGHKVAKPDPRSKRPQPAVPLTMSSEGQKTSYEPVTPPAEILRKMNAAAREADDGQRTSMGDNMKDDSMVFAAVDANSTAFGGDMDARSTAFGAGMDANSTAFGAGMDAKSTAFGEGMDLKERAFGADVDLKATSFGASMDPNATTAGEVSGNDLTTEGAKFDPAATLIPDGRDLMATSLGGAPERVSEPAAGRDPDTAVGTDMDMDKGGFVDEHLAVTKAGNAAPSDPSDTSDEVTAFSVPATKEKGKEGGRGGFREELIPTKPYATADD